MRYFNRATIFLTVLLYALCGLVSAETLYRPDSSKVEFTMGCVYYYQSDVNDSEYQASLACIPIFKEPADSLREITYDAMDFENVKFYPRTGLPYYVPLKKEFIDSAITDKIGDTLLIVHENGTLLCVIYSIGLDNGTLDNTPFCLLKPFDGKTNITGNIIAARKTKSYNGPIIHFESYNITDSLQLALADSLGRELSREWAKWAWGQEYAYRKYEITNMTLDPNRRHYDFYRPAGKMNTDTSFWGIYFNTDASGDCFNLYKVLNSSDKIVTQKLLAKHIESIHFQILFAVDLNEDGNLEYITANFAGLTNDNDMYQIRNNTWIMIASGCWEGN
jgi:hypothetical protein